MALSLTPTLFAGVTPATVLINEVDADTPSTDTAEFIELFDGGAGNTALDGLVLVLFNGNGDVSYAAFDLDGQTTDASGYFVICGNASNVANCDLDASPDSDLVQNGADAVALYLGDATDFPNGTAVTTANLLDALVYDTNDSDDAGLLVLLNASEPQINENGGGDKDNESNSRFPNGSGGARNTTAYTQCDPTPGAANCVAPPPAVSGICGDPATIISAIQGPGATSRLNGSPNVVIEGVVGGDFQDGLGGFYVQEEDFDRDGDIATSEGIFVFSSIPVEEGDIVRVQGDVLEFGSGRTITEITNVDGVLGCSTGAMVTPEILSMPFPNPPEPYLEQFEGMLVEMVQPLAVTEFFNFGRFGEMRLANLGKLPQFTHFNAPDPTGFANQQAQAARNTITLDDGRSGQNLAPLANGYDIDLNALRGGDVTNYLFGILDDRFGLYRIQPVATPTFTQANPRPAAPPAVGGRLKVAAFNVLNFFTTVDAGADICGPSLLECRGADDEGGDGLTPSRTEYERQLAKLILALQELDADIYGLVELENNYDPAFRNGSPNSAAGRIAAELTTAGGTASCNSFSSVEPGVSVGTDAIAVGFVYCTATVKIADGTSVEILDDSDLPMHSNLAAIAAALLSAAMAPALAAASISFNVSDPSIFVGDSFSVDVTADDVFANFAGETLIGFGFDFMFDPAFLQLQSVTEAPVFAPAALTPASLATINTSGLLTLEGLAFPGVDDPFPSTLNQLLASFQFQAIGGGSTALTLTGDSAGVPPLGLTFLFGAESIAGSQNLDINAVPEPGAVSLLGLGLLGLAALRRRVR